jgi:hypothetical protein
MTVMVSAEILRNFGVIYVTTILQKMAASSSKTSVFLLFWHGGWQEDFTVNKEMMGSEVLTAARMWTVMFCGV